jgi:hypothetical protein
MMLVASRMKIRHSIVRRHSQRHRTDWPVRGRPDYDALARELAGLTWKHTELVNKIVESAGVSVRTAKNRIEELVDLGKMIKQTDGKYTVVAQ